MIKTLDQGFGKLPVKGQDILGLGYMVSVTTTQFCSCHAKAVTDNI